MRGETSTPIRSAVSARPRRAWATQTTYEPRPKVCEPSWESCFSSSTSTPLNSSHSTSRLASGSLRCPSPTGMTYACGYSSIQLLVDVEGRRAACRPRSVRDGPPENLELVEEHVGAVLDDVVEGRPGRDLLDLEGARAAAASALAPTHLHRGAVQPDVLRVHGRVERAPVVPALGDRRTRV